MVNNKCFVPNCTPGYKSKPEKVSMFSTKDPVGLTLWSRAIPRFDRCINENDSVCKIHFNQEDIIKCWKGADDIMICMAGTPLKRATMALKLSFLVILGLQMCRSEQPNEVLAVALSEVLTVNITTCDDAKNVFSAMDDSKKFNGVNNPQHVFDYIKVLAPASNMKLGNNFSQILFFINNSKVVQLGVRIFEKLVNMKSTKLNRAILTFQEHKQFNWEYYFLSAFDVIYNHKVSSARRETVEKFLAMKLSELNLRRANAEREYGYFEKLTTKKLRSHAKSFICAFSMLANFSNHYAVVQLMRPFEVLVEDANSSTAILLFLNKVLITAMEEHDCVGCVYRSLLVEYLLKRLHEVILLNEPTAVDMKDSSKNLRQANPEVITTFLDWISRMQNDLVKKGISQYFIVLDKPFRQTNRRRGYVNGDTEPLNKDRLAKIEKKLNDSTISTRLKKFLTHAMEQLKSPNEGEDILHFIDECLDQIFKYKKLDVMIPVYHYMTKKLNLIGRVNMTLFQIMCEKQVEEVAALLQQYFEFKPVHVMSVALDWIFSFKIQMISRDTNSNVFNLLDSSYKDIIRRLNIRMHDKQRTTPLTSFNPFAKVKLSKEDEQLIRQAMGV